MKQTQAHLTNLKDRLSSENAVCWEMWSNKVLIELSGWTSS